MPLNTSLTSSSVPTRESYRQRLLRRFLEAYWLRPENAFWMTLRSDTLGRLPLEHPSVDLGCGDGVFSFLHAGGVFDPLFDVFTTVGRLERVHTSHADIFDHFDASYEPPIVSAPIDCYDVGADLKPTMLEKARKLNFYGKLVGHDNNKPLPFEEDSFRTVYCNCAYWVVKIESFLREMRRIVHPEGRVILQVKMDSLWKYTLEGFRSQLGDRFLDIIGRGRAVTWPSVGSRSAWEKRFTEAGFEIDEATLFITRTHAHIWDVGLRPIAPLLVKMARELSPATRGSIKKEWVDLFAELLEPLCSPTFDLLPGEGEPAEIQYVLRKGT